MAFYNEITQYNTLTTTHCDNFNEVNQKLLENTLQNHQDIGNLNLLSTTQKDSLVSAVNEIKQSIPSSTNINQTIDQKISTHNQLTTSHQDIRSQVKTLENQIQGINISANIETHNTNQTAHQDIRSEINVLSNEKMDKNKDNITEKGLTIDNWLTIDGDTGGKSNFLCNLYNDNDGNYRYVNSHGGGSGAGFRTSIFDRKPKFIYSTDIAATKDEIANIVEIDLATTSKTDILCTPKAGVTIVEQKSYMVNNVVYISIMFKKTDNSAINSIFSAINVPSFARPLMEIPLSVAVVDAVGNGIVNKSISCPLNTSGDIWVVSDTESVATQIRVNGVFVL